MDEQRSVILVELACFAMMGGVITLLQVQRGDWPSAMFGALAAAVLALTVFREYAGRHRRLVLARADGRRA